MKQSGGIRYRLLSKSILKIKIFYPKSNHIAVGKILWKMQIQTYCFWILNLKRGKMDLILLNN